MAEPTRDVSKSYRRLPDGFPAFGFVVAISASVSCHGSVSQAYLRSASPCALAKTLIDQNPEDRCAFYDRIQPRLAAIPGA
jgi:hypothetical protein